MTFFRLFLIPAAMLLGTFGNTAADMNKPLQTRLSDSLVSSFFPEADGFEVDHESSALAHVKVNGLTTGYLFSTHEMAEPKGFKGDSFDIIIALDSTGRLVGHRVLEQHEPLVSPDKVSEATLSQYLNRLNG
ncbi:uncharacterized protein METZ01_LOCUS423796, partial [marine metagenome]